VNNPPAAPPLPPPPCMSESCNGRERRNLSRTAHSQMGEKLYAIKVSPVHSCLSPPFPGYYTMGPSMLITLPPSLRSSRSVTRMNLKRNTSRSLQQNSASPPHCIMPTSLRPLILSRMRTKHGVRSWSFALAGTYIQRSRRGLCRQAKSSAVSSKY